MIFDTWGGVLSPGHYEEFSLRYMQQIVDGLVRVREDRTIPIVLFTKGAGLRLGSMANTGCDALGVDWTINLADARRLVEGKVALQGNLDPATLRAEPAAIRAAVGSTLSDYGDSPGHVFNLGHGITPDINPANLKVLVDSVHELSRRDL